VFYKVFFEAFVKNEYAYLHDLYLLQHGHAFMGATYKCCVQIFAKKWPYA